MLEQKQVDTFIRSTLLDQIIEQSSQQKGQSTYKCFNFTINLLSILKQCPGIIEMIFKDYPLFIQTLDKTIKKIAGEISAPLSIYGNKLSIFFQNCTIPIRNIKSVQFMTAMLNQPQGALIYLKDAQIVNANQSQLYLQSWNEVWEYVCDCYEDQKLGSKLVKKRKTQTLLDLITKGSGKNLKESCQRQQMMTCQKCNLNLRYITSNQLVYEHCSQIQILLENKQNYSRFKQELLNFQNVKIYVDKFNCGNLKKGQIFDCCCYLKSTVELLRNFKANGRAQCQIRNYFYLVCSYPQQFYSNISNDTFFGKLDKICLQQKPITKINSINDIIYNYKQLTQAVNQIRYPYLESNTLTAMKLITLSSIFSHQANAQKLHLLVITDQISMVIKFLKIHDLPIKAFPTLYDQKTVSNFFHSCQNSIVLIPNPDKRQFCLINKVLKKELFDNINFVCWIICEPEENLKKKIEIKQIDIILDLTIEKNLNVCESVYVSMVDTCIDSFMEQADDSQQFVPTMQKKFTNQFHQSLFDNNVRQTNFKSLYEGQSAKEQRLAKDILKRYFLKSRQFKTTKLNNLETLHKIAQSFMHFRYFIHNKGFPKSFKAKDCNYQRTENHHLSVLDAILAIFIDEQTSRNKYSSSNTLFADDVSKIMLNQNNCDVSIWDFEMDGEYVQERKKYVPKDEMVRMVIQKIFNLIFQDD